MRGAWAGSRSRARYHDGAAVAGREGARGGSGGWAIVSAVGEGDARTIDAGPPAGAAVGTASTVLGGVTPAEPGPRLTRGAVLGRYFIIEPLGAGGMGVVYTAYDPELDRKVAI